MTQSQVRAMFIKNKPGVRRPGMGGYWYRCAHCGKWCGRSGGDNINIPSDSIMEVDHQIPWSCGGSDRMDNLVPSCRTCNRAKSNNQTVGDTVRSVKSLVTHPVDTIVGVPLRKAARQNKVLKGLGITKRK
jgi:5-methylcytosine-specific restriction endonuclease McrA